MLESVVHRLREKLACCPTPQVPSILGALASESGEPRTAVTNGKSLSTECQALGGAQHWEQGYQGRCRDACAHLASSPTTPTALRRALAPHLRPPRALINRKNSY